MLGLAARVWEQASLGPAAQRAVHKLEALGVRSGRRRPGRHRDPHRHGRAVVPGAARGGPDPPCGALRLPQARRRRARDARGAALGRRLAPRPLVSRRSRRRPRRRPGVPAVPRRRCRDGRRRARRLRRARGRRRRRHDRRVRPGARFADRHDPRRRGPGQRAAPPRDVRRRPTAAPTCSRCRSPTTRRSPPTSSGSARSRSSSHPTSLRSAVVRRLRLAAGEGAA